MTTFFEETWTGANGASWNAAKWQNTGQSSTSLRDIQGNEGRSVPQGTNYAYSRAQAIMSPVADFDFTGTFRLGTTGEQYHSICFRGGTTWSGSFSDELDSCYKIAVYDGNFGFGKVSGGIRTGLASGGATWGTAAWNFRIQCQGTSIRIRWWQGSEPGTWQVDVTDASHAAGSIAVASVNGGAATARPVFFDTFLAQSLEPVALTTTNLQDSASNDPPTLVGDLDDDPESPDANSWSPVDETLPTVALLTWPTPNVALNGSPQHFIANLYCTAGSPSTPAKGKLTLYENGAPAAPEVSVEADITETDGQVVILPWSGGDVTLAGDVELRIDGTPGVTGETAINSVGLRAVRWMVNQAAPEVEEPTDPIVAIYLGGDQVIRVYRGTTLIFGDPPA